MQIIFALGFYAVFLACTAIGLPFTKHLMENKFLAYTTAKLLGLLLFGYLIWLLGFLQILDYQYIGIITIFFLAAVCLGAFASRDFFKNPEPAAKNLKKQGKNNAFIKKILWLEIFTCALYFAYLYLRSYNATINGTESFMDMALLTAAGKTHYFPFIDPWYAGKTINYYYYGSYLMSLLSNIARAPYALAYNFSLGLLFSQACMLPAVFIYSLTRSKLMAFAAAFLITLSGTLFFAGCSLKADFAQTPQTCTYASSTRLYTPSYIINEVPSYSFTVGDLHAHLLALPFFLLNLILLFTLYRGSKPKWMLIALLALSLTTSGMINLWDLVSLVCLSAIVLGLKTILSLWDKDKNHNKKTAGLWLLAAATLAICVGFLTWVNLIAYHSPVLGIGFAYNFAKLNHLTNVQYPTPFLAEVGMWGIFLAGSAWSLWSLRKKIPDILFFAALLVLAAGIIIGVEIIFIKDIYSVANPPYFRANTTFKFGYHAWTLLALVFCAGIAGKILPSKDNQKTSKLAKLILAVAIIGGSFYPLAAINQFYLVSKNSLSLNGGEWMQRENPGDLAAVNYINNNFKDRAVIAEAVGDSYTTHSRITTFTGMATPMGWQTHEWTWRLDGTQVKNAKPGQAVETGWGKISAVSADIKRLYETQNPDEARNIISKYDIQYVYIGDLEKTDYPNLQAEKFSRIGKIVFNSETSTLFKVN